MLDIRATGYVSPLAEVPFTDVPLTVHLLNVADETGLVTGTFRVYNDTLGTLIHTSAIAPVTLTAGQDTDAPALTDFLPPAPVDDTYFVLFDGLATNPLVPDGIGIHLGAFSFDVKPGGLGTPPAAHAPTHEEGGADPLETGDLATTELDQNLRLSPDGAGGVKWALPLAIITDHDLLTHLDYADAGHTGFAPDPHDNAAHSVTFEDQANKGAAGGYCGLPNPLDTTRPLRADGTANYPSSLFEFDDLLYDESYFNPWRRTVLLSGLIAPIAGEANHPGILRISARAAVGGTSGYSVYMGQGLNQILLAGSENAHFVLRPLTLAGSFLRLGFIDTAASVDATDGCYFEMAQVGGVDGVIVGKCAAAGVRSTTASNFTLITNTWYHFLIEVNAAANLVTFTLFSAAGATLWTDTVNANIPTAVGQETSHGVHGWSTTGSSTTIVDIDYISLEIRRALVR
jgi:hypothetical protein